MKKYAKLGLAALAIIVIVLILWLTGVFGGAEHNNRSPNDSGGCRYPTPTTRVIPQEYQISSVHAPRAERSTQNVYGFAPAGSARIPFLMYESDYAILGGHPDLYSSYLAYIRAIANTYTDATVRRYTFNYASFWTAASSTPFLTPSQYANNQQRATAGLSPLDPVLVPTGCGVNAWTAPDGCVIGQYVAEDACANVNAPSNVAQGSTSIGDLVAHPYRVVINTSMPVSRPTPVDGLGLSSIGLSNSNITGITGTVAGVPNVNLLEASSDEIAANNLRAAPSPTVYMCCQTPQNAREADTAANAEFTSNKAVVLNGRKAEIARLTALVSRLGQMATEAAGALGAAQTSAQDLLDTKYIHGFSSTGSFRA